jgi:hypothetical protein
MLEVINKSKAEKALALEAQLKEAKTEPAAPSAVYVTIEEEEIIESGSAVNASGPPAPTSRSPPKPQIAPASMPPPPRPPRSITAPIAASKPKGPLVIRSALKPAYDDLDSLLSGISTSSSMFSYLDRGSAAPAPAQRDKSRYTGPASYYSTSGSDLHNTTAAVDLRET